MFKFIPIRNRDMTKNEVKMYERKKFTNRTNKNDKINRKIYILDVQCNKFKYKPE